jgi:hypothetical protein
MLLQGIKFVAEAQMNPSAIILAQRLGRGTNCPISVHELEDSSSEAHKALNAMTTKEDCLLHGTITSTDDSASIVLPFDPVAQGGERRHLSAIQHVTAPAFICDSQGKTLSETTACMAIPVYFGPNPEFYVDYGLNANDSDPRWSTVFLVSIMHAALEPVLASLSEAITCLILRRLTLEQGTDVLPRMFLHAFRPVYDNNRRRVNHLKGRGLALIMSCNPFEMQHHIIKETILRLFLGDVDTARVLTTMIGLPVAITTPTGSNKPFEVSVGSISDHMLTNHQQWMYLRRLPTWFTSELLRALLIVCLAVRDITNVFSFKEHFNAYDKPDGVRDRFTFVVSFSTPEALRACLDASAVLKRGFSDFINSVPPSEVSQELEYLQHMDSDDHAESIGISSPNAPNQPSSSFRTLPHTDCKTTDLVYEPQTLEELVHRLVNGEPLTPAVLSAPLTPPRSHASPNVDQTAADMVLSDEDRDTDAHVSVDPAGHLSAHQSANSSERLLSPSRKRAQSVLVKDDLMKTLAELLTTADKTGITSDVLNCIARAHAENPSYAVKEIVYDWAFDFLPTDFCPVGSSREAKGNN